MRIGSRIRFQDRRHPTKNCATGFYPIEPRGWVCAGQGLALDAEAVQSGFAITAPDREHALPYAYYFVTQTMTAEYHRPPSDQERRAVWSHARRYHDLQAEDEQRAARFRAGQLPDEPEPPGVVRRFMDRGFYVAVPRAEADVQSEFVRTVRGSTVWRARLKAQGGSGFQGVELTPERTLPVAWMRRSARPRRRRARSDGTPRWAENPEWPVRERQTVVEDWLRREPFGEHVMHVLQGDQYYLSWFIAVAEPVDRQLIERLGIAEDEVFVHVDLSEQTLVVYRGPTPIFATLVSTGAEGHETPTGYFRIQRKMISDTMANLGSDAGDDAYRIEDVPWTQYFEGSLALHGAFWHDRFGLPRSHGCINLSPQDAHRLFELTQPTLPMGWHGVEASRELPGSRVLVTP